MKETFKLQWTSMNTPTTAVVYWEVGVIFDFHIKSKTKEGAQAIRLNTELNDLEKDTRFIVTDVIDRTSIVQNNDICKFQIQANVYKDGVAEEKCIHIGYGSVPCMEACWLEKVETYKFQNKVINVEKSKVLIYLTYEGKTVRG